MHNLFVILSVLMIAINWTVGLQKVLHPKPEDVNVNKGFRSVRDGPDKVKVRMKDGRVVLADGVGALNSKCASVHNAQ